MKNNIIIIIPYFGKLPNYFPAFLHSINHLKSHIDFCLYTDCEEVYKLNLPSNLIVRKRKFCEIQELLRKKDLGNLYTAYKICDYRPLYAFIFENETSEYEYWGYCDIDTMMGDVYSFLERINYQQYDRIGVAGHFTIYRNSPEINKLAFTKIPGPKDFTWNFVSKSTLPCHFDEYGMNMICDYKKINFYKKIPYAQPRQGYDLHLHTFNNVDDSELFVWEKGHIYIYKLSTSGNISKKEYMYVHFEDRKNMPINEELGDKVIITHQGFFNFDESKIMDYFKDWGRTDSVEERVEYSELTRKAAKKAKKKRLKTELKECGFFRFCYNIINLLYSSYWFKKNKINLYK